ncbi:Blp family class II bacteriocin [Streptococcus hyointestinalis]|uniref:Bacteriocin class II with double-glycine leader peptide n=1 Tax=Streptococcus hyointestinalis TaxID=1337 RepID=A0A380KA66_9STRE|nr:Blp family class II bacteriocin [Streptococcus hyointestinalis]MDD6385633.1 Blp family class II bacteriocin [Streptococcus hyointestinalis]SUN61489.1 Bacteriocin class II with double-glycine leader peptide [Streptococcus hyointestinalis]
MMTAVEQFEALNEDKLELIEGGDWAKCVLGTTSIARLRYLSGGVVGGWSGVLEGVRYFC